MKNILCVVCVSAVVVLLASVNAEDDDDNMLRQIASDCIKETGATDEDLDGMIAKKLPETRTGKCLSFCMMNQFNCLSKTGDFQQEEFMDLIKMRYDDDKLLTMCDEVSKKCVGTKDPNNDNCETAALLLKCLDDGAKEAGYKNI